MSVLRRLGLLGAVRSNAEVAEEAREEIAFHLESRVRDLVEAGEDEESAQRTAAESFGDVEAVVDVPVEKALKAVDRGIKKRDLNRISSKTSDKTGTTTVIARDAEDKKVTVQVTPRGKELSNKALTRKKFSEFLVIQPQSLVAFESCATAHYWARYAKRAGHQVRILPAISVAPFRQGHKTDQNDALVEAVGNRTAKQQHDQIGHSRCRAKYPEIHRGARQAEDQPPHA